MDQNMLMMMMLMGGGRGGFGGSGFLGFLVDQQNWFLAKIMGKRYTNKMAMLAMLMGDGGKSINQLQIITQQNTRRRSYRRRSYRRRYRRRW